MQDNFVTKIRDNKTRLRPQWDSSSCYWVCSWSSLFIYLPFLNAYAVDSTLAPDVGTTVLQGLINSYNYVRPISCNKCITVYVVISPTASASLAEPCLIKCMCCVFSQWSYEIISYIIPILEMRKQNWRLKNLSKFTWQVNT